ncbi:MAG: hypothetical protein ACRELC_05125, partial [Gemmatimonadota bacterium]
QYAESFYFLDGALAEATMASDQQGQAIEQFLSGAGDEVEIEVSNEGGRTHDFTVELLELSTGPIEEGAVATATLTVPPGETMFACTIHGGMEGVIVGT